MSFPTSPTNGQTATVNDVNYVYASATQSWTRLPTANVTVGNVTVTDIFITANIASNLIPNANVTYNLGSSDYRWKDLYLSGSSIVIGSETISVSDGTFAFTSNGGAQTGNVFLGNVDTSGKLIVNDDTNAIPYVMGSGAFHVVGGMSIGKDFWVGGNIYVANVISQSTTILEVNEPLVYLDASDYPYNYDIGVFSDFIGGSANNYQYTGAVRSYQTNEWVFFSNLQTTPGAGIVSITSADVLYDPIKAGNIIAANTTPSTSTDTGALIVKGGAGIAGNLNIGSSLVINPDQSTISSQLLTTDYFALATNGTAPGASIISASTTAAHRAVFKGTRARGNLSVPDAPVANDQVLSLLGAIYDGSASQGTAVVDFIVDGTVSSGVAPQRIVFTTSATNAASRTPRLIISSGGNVVVTQTTTSTSTTTGALVVKGGAGFAANIFTAGWIIPSGNVSQNLGSSTQWWNLVYGKSVQAQYADLAENYVADKNYVPGTVVVFGGDAEITATSTDHDPRVAGVISTDPAYLMNAASNGLPVALTGRVPCMVLGPVDKGDRLVTSKMSGVAQRLIDGRYIPGCIFAKSLETIEKSEVKLIEIAVGRD